MAGVIVGRHEVELHLRRRQLIVHSDDHAIGEQPLGAQVSLVNDQVHAAQRRVGHRSRWNRDERPLALPALDDSPLDQHLHGAVGGGGADAEHLGGFGRALIRITRLEVLAANIQGDLVGQLNDPRSFALHQKHLIVLR